MELDETEQREKIILNVREGWKSDYWTAIRDQIKQWILEEESYLDGFKAKGMSASHMEDFNNTRDRIDFMRKFLNINQIIIAENETLLARLKSGVRSTLKKVQSFVTR